MGVQQSTNFQSNHKMGKVQSQWLWIILICLSVLHSVSTFTTPIVVAQTKGIQIKLAESKIAIGTLELKFKVNLPSVDIRTKINDSLCTPALSEGSYKACQALTRIDKMSVNVLLELQKIFQRTENLDSLKPRREKRALVPLLGKVYKFIAGVATEADLNKVISNVNQLGQGVKDLAQSHQNLIKSTEHNFEQVKNHQTEIEKHLRNLDEQFNNLVKGIGHFESEFDIVMLKIVGTTTLMNKINVLEAHLIALKSIYERCQNNLLPKIVVEESKIKEALNRQEATLAEHALGLVYDVSSMSSYYDLQTADCKLLNNQSLEITIDAPLKDAKSNFHVMDIEPLKFLLKGQTCQLVKKTVRIATDGVVIRDLTSASKLGSLDIYMLPRYNSQSELSRCIYKLLTHANVEDIAMACELQCVDSIQSTVQQLSIQTYSVLNPGSPLAIICGTTLVQNLPVLTDGRVEVVLPCHCSIQETSGSQNTLIAAIRTCNINLNNNNTVTVNQEWASDTFEPYQLFTTDRDFEHLKIQNFSIPKLSLVKLDPFKSDALSNWKPLPIYGSGWVETCLWIIIFVVLFVIGYCYLKAQFPWLAMDLCKRAAVVQTSTIKRDPTFVVVRANTPCPRARSGHGHGDIENTYAVVEKSDS